MPENSFCLHPAHSLLPPRSEQSSYSLHSLMQGRPNNGATIPSRENQNKSNHADIVNLPFIQNSPIY